MFASRVEALKNTLMGALLSYPDRHLVSFGKSVFNDDTTVWKSDAKSFRCPLQSFGPAHWLRQSGQMQGEIGVEKLISHR